MVQVVYSKKTETRNDYKTVDNAQYDHLARMNEQDGTISFPHDLPLRITIMPRDMRIDIVFDEPDANAAQQIKELAERNGLRGDTYSVMLDPDSDTQSVQQVTISATPNDHAKLKRFIASEALAAIMPQDAINLMNQHLDTLSAKDKGGAVARLEVRSQEPGGMQRGGDRTTM